MTSEDEDQSSLFGSPGPSRSPSPTLVLPGVSDGIVQNVGTIALPGSQHFSELPKDPLALSLTYLAPRPAAQVNSRSDVAAVPSPAPSAPPSGASTPSTRSRASSLVPPATGPKKRKRTRKETQPSPAPSIALPDSSAPLPPN